jgi:hypothetical protein
MFNGRVVSPLDSSCNRKVNNTTNSNNKIKGEEAVVMGYFDKNAL